MPLSDSQIFALSLQLSTFTFTLVLGAPFAFGMHIFMKLVAGKQPSHNLNTTDDDMGLTESCSSSTELLNLCAGI
jgi:hypothetical protein